MMQRRPLARAAAAFAVLATLLAACAGSSPPPGRKGQRTVLLTEADDVRVGREETGAVAAEMGVLDDPALEAYLNGIGRKLLRGAPVRSYDYQFKVVDQTEPNAFALPGGFIYVSRGLLLLANSEDELACVMGHEITHVVHRHAAQQQALASAASPLTMPWVRAGQMAAYGRDMERDADQGGQLLCAAAGYDPAAMSTFLTTLVKSERLRAGYSRTPGFFDTHPGSEERAAANSVRASEIRWKRDPTLGDTRAALLKHLDGLEVGDRPENGVFVGDRFLHPDLDFQLRFPSGWAHSNTPQAVGAQSPRGDAIVFLVGEAPAGSPQEAADAFLAKAGSEPGQTIEVQDSRAVKVGALDAWRLRLAVSGRGGSVGSVVTLIPYRGATYRITGAAPSLDAEAGLAAATNTARTFAPLGPADRASLRVTRLRVATARPGEGLAAIGQRTRSAWDPETAAVQNGVFGDHRYKGGELVKIAIEGPYVPAGKP